MFAGAALRAAASPLQGSRIVKTSRLSSTCALNSVLVLVLTIDAAGALQIHQGSQLFFTGLSDVSHLTKHHC
jgi:hypothetical protein